MSMLMFSERLFGCRSASIFVARLTALENVRQSE